MQFYIVDLIHVFTNSVSTVIDFKINVFVGNRALKEHVFRDILAIRLMINV